MSTDDVQIPSEAFATLTGDAGDELPEFTTPPRNPVSVLRRWIYDAVRGGVREPLALALCTVNADGKPSSRTVAIKQIDDAGLTFSTGGSSAKVSDIRQNPFVSGTLYWRETLQQVNIAGRAVTLSSSASDRLFRERPRTAQAVAIAVRSGAALPRGADLQEAVDELLRSEEPLVRPEDWRGYRIECERVEFWQGSPTRIHRRLIYERRGTTWASSRVQP